MTQCDFQFLVNVSAIRDNECLVTGTLFQPHLMRLIISCLANLLSDSLKSAFVLTNRLKEGMSVLRQTMNVAAE